MELHAVFGQELAKMAKIWGVSPDPFATSTHPAIDPKARERAMEEYATAKSREEPSNLALSLLGGGAAGALPGAGIGFLTGGPVGGLLGAGIGGGIGALGGAAARSYDIGKIEHAKQMASDKIERSRELARMMSMREDEKTHELSPTRAMLLKHLLERMDRD
jgi:hypothetical protein